MESYLPTRQLGGATGSLFPRAVMKLSGKGWDEPYESRGSHTDLWETGGAIPPVDPADPPSPLVREATIPTRCSHACLWGSCVASIITT
jgi:hypothetical protein